MTSTTGNFDFFIYFNFMCVGCQPAANRACKKNCFPLTRTSKLGARELPKKILTYKKKEKKACMQIISNKTRPNVVPTRTTIAKRRGKSKDREGRRFVVVVVVKFIMRKYPFVFGGEGERGEKKSVVLTVKKKRRCLYANEGGKDRKMQYVMGCRQVSSGPGPEEGKE